MRRNTLGQIGTLYRWTPATIECYERGCNCEGCKCKNILTKPYKCQAKASVLELVRKLGRPKGSEREGVLV